SRVRMRFVEEDERDMGHVEIQKERWEKKARTRSKPIIVLNAFTQPRENNLDA
ncbi:hypothetical protein Tco_0299400, partial [Tanacetum coccineum]